MAETQTQTGGGKTFGASKKTWEIVGIAVVGGAVLYFGYRWYEDRKAAASTSTEGGTVVPSATTGAVSGTSATPGTTSPTTLSEWIEAAVKGTGLTFAKFYNAVTDWQNGQSVTATGYAEISKALSTYGLPPNAIDYPLTVASGSTTTRPVTQPAPSKTTPYAKVLGTWQGAPTTKSFHYQGATYTPITTWVDTLALLQKGTTVFVKTKTTGIAVPMTATRLKALEHTGTQKYPQFTTYQKT